MSLWLSIPEDGLIELLDKITNYYITPDDVDLSSLRPDDEPTETFDAHDDAPADEKGDRHKFNEWSRGDAEPKDVQWPEDFEETKDVEKATGVEEATGVENPENGWAAREGWSV